MKDRKALLADFIAINELSGAIQQPLPRDASFRRYIRLNGGDEQLIVMDAPPPKENVRPFIKIAAHLEKLGLSVPHVWASDEDSGFLLLEDFGDNTFTKLFAKNVGERPLYEDAIDVLIALHNNPANADIDLPAYDLASYQREAGLLTKWYLPEVEGSKWTKEGNDAYLTAWADIIEALPWMKPTLVLRDYHVDNLMILENRNRLKNCGLLDFQDALIGNAAYDVLSLLEDARRSVPKKIQACLLDRYLNGVNCQDRDDFMKWYAVLAAQRHAKVAGIFIRLYRRDRKDIYLKHIPRVIEYLAGHLKNPALKPLAIWFDRYFPNYQDMPKIIK